jgi:RNA polymerase sigma-70 factor (ECF subfamily)
LKDRAAVRAWLYSIARNETKRYFHNNRIRLFPNTISIDEPDGPDAEDPIESTFPEVLANAELLAELLNRLTEEEQQLILLHYYYDLSLKEIAEINDVNYNTLKSITRRAMARLRSLAAAEQEETDDR